MHILLNQNHFQPVLAIFRGNLTLFSIFPQKNLTKKPKFAKIRPVLTFLAIFSQKNLTFFTFLCIINANVVMRAKKSRHHETEIRKLAELRNDTVNQRIDYSIVGDRGGHRHYPCLGRKTRPHPGTRSGAGRRVFGQRPRGILGRTE